MESGEHGQKTHRRFPSRGPETSGRMGAELGGSEGNEKKMASTASSTVGQDSWYVALLGLAEHFRTSNPPDVRLCVHCLQTVFNFKPPLYIEARTHLQIGTVLLSSSTHSKNLDLALSHLDRAVSKRPSSCPSRGVSPASTVLVHRENRPVAVGRTSILPVYYAVGYRSAVLTHWSANLQTPEDH